MKTYAPQILRVIFGYAGRGLLLAAVATTLTVTACGDEDDGVVPNDAAVDSLPLDTMGGGDTAKPGDGGSDTRLDASDAKPADAAGDASSDAAADATVLL